MERIQGAAIRDCVVCGYSLRGAVSPIHTCPECGTPYDKDTLVWRQSRLDVSSRIKHLFPYACMLVLALLTRNWAGRLGALTGMVALATVGPYKRPWRFLSLRASVAFAALCRDGVILGLSARRESVQKIDWPRVVLERPGCHESPTSRLILEHLRDFANDIEQEVVEEVLGTWVSRSVNVRLRENGTDKMA